MLLAKVGKAAGHASSIIIEHQSTHDRRTAAARHQLLLYKSTHIWLALARDVALLLL
jgi:hypothetical protein